jgi:hypothetical protein
VGNIPFTELVISEEDGAEWYIDRREKEILEDYQQRLVTVRGRPETLELILANGEPAGTRRILRDITVLSPPPP